MKLALIGYGAMGRLVSARATTMGHEVGRVLTSTDANRSVDERAEQLRGHDVAIDFSVAEAVLSNIDACTSAGVPLVEGTTGWSSRETEARRMVWKRHGGLLFGSNFSIGANLFYRLVERAAELFEGSEDYAPFIEEAHHARKRDAPSGTALRLSQILAARLGQDVPTSSTRAGHIPGTHRVGFDSVADQVLLVHTARSREGFAAGALLAAEWMAGRQGIYEFSSILDNLLEFTRRRAGETAKSDSS